MSVQDAQNRLNDQLRIIGKVNLNANYPEEFELYLFAFELLDGDGRTMKYFLFPVNPSTFKQTDRPVENIQKTMAGLAVVSNATFTPKTIAINGNFGRRLRFLIGKNTISAVSKYVENQVQTFKKTKKFAKGKITTQTFDTNVKTGYGSFKILSNIVQESKYVDNGKPRTLLFYNLALGESYVVRVTEFSPDMNQDTNMIWGYSLQMVAIAPAEVFITDYRKQLALNQFAQQRVQDTFKFINKFINTEDVFRAGNIAKIGRSSNSYAGLMDGDNIGPNLLQTLNIG